MVKRTTALITGAAGFLGTSLARCLQTAGWAVVGMDLSPTPHAGLFSKYRQGDLNDTEVLPALLREIAPACVIHLAGRAEVGRSLLEPVDDFTCGPMLFAKVLEAVRRHAPQTKVLLASSAAVYGQPDKLPVAEDAATHPLSPYGYHKRMSELLTQEYYHIYRVPTALVRIFSAYGDGLRKQLIWDLCRKCTQGEIALQGTGEETRDFIHADDVGQAVRLILDRAAFRAEAYNVASGQAVTIRQVGETVLEAFGLPLDMLHFTGDSRPGDPKHWQAEVAKLRQWGFSPRVTLRAGVADYVRWFKQEARAA